MDVGSSRIRDPTCLSCTGRQILYHWATREALSLTVASKFSQWFCLSCHIFIQGKSHPWELPHVGLAGRIRLQALPPPSSMLLPCNTALETLQCDLEGTTSLQKGKGEFQRLASGPGASKLLRDAARLVFWELPATSRLPADLLCLLCTSLCLEH